MSFPFAFLKCSTPVVVGAAIALLPLAQAQTKPFPVSKAESGPAFDFQSWRKAVAKIDHETWEKNHPGPYNSWFSGESEKCAKGYEITWGPLGIRTLMHDHTWAGLPAFKAQWPKCLLDSNGDLVFDCFEVVAVIPGSPAEGNLQAGDLLVSMDGDLFRTALNLRPQAALLQFQETRSLEMDAGEKLDRAEGRGRVSFDVIRPGGATAPLAGKMVKDLQVTEEMRGGGLLEVELDVPVTEGQELTAYLELTRDHNGSCGGTFIRPRLEGPAGTMDLSAARRISEVSGYGKITRSNDQGGKPITYKDKPVAESILLHAPGQLGWVVPKGYNRFRTTLVANPAAHGFKARLAGRTSPRGLPPALTGVAKTVSFNIPKIGNYVRGFPNNGDAKSAMVAKMTAAWLADQQQPDGSWKRTCGYTHAGYDTAWAGLGLMSQGDPAYDGNIRKAAEYVAFRSPQDHWAVPSAMMISFLSEYYLRTGDKSILVALQTQVERMQGQMIYGDWNSGHGGTPGYRGTGVSIGGSHSTLALALANLTPAKVEPGIVDRMLARAQELGPDGYIPYGRATASRKFEPDLETGATYSGRHGPYLVASMIHGGPKLFTRNCSALYTKGSLGGIDQGHATQSLAMGWALIAAAIVDPQALERHMEAMRWKFTMLRCFDGGFGWNAYRLEYQGGEGLLPNYLRSGSYLVALNAHKHNLAMTGAPKYQAKSFPDLPPVCDGDAVALGYYQRNWGVADAVLGEKSPPGLKAGLTRLLGMGKGKETRAELYGFLKTEAAPLARVLLVLDGVDPLQRQYLAEMVMGVDLRLAVDPEEKEGKAIPGSWAVQCDVQYPLAGYFTGAEPAELAAWRTNPPLPMEGSVEIVDAGGKAFIPAIKIERDCGKDGWQVRSTSTVVPGPASGPIPLTARVRYRVGDLEFNYDRPLRAGAEEAGGPEKQRKIVNDRVIWVKGKILRDLNDWSASFHLPSGQFISAATQGGGVRVESGAESWIAPEGGVIPAGSGCEFGFTSGWQAYEGRVGVVRLAAEPPLVRAKSVKVDRKELDPALLGNRDRSAAQTLAFPAKAGDPLEIEIELEQAVELRALDMRLKENGQDLRMAIEVEAGGGWQMVFQGRPGERSSAFEPVKAKRLRVQLSRKGESREPVLLEELHLLHTAA